MLCDYSSKYDVAVGRNKAPALACSASGGACRRTQISEGLRVLARIVARVRVESADEVVDEDDQHWDETPDRNKLTERDNGLCNSR